MDGAQLARIGFVEPDRAIHELPAGALSDPRWIRLLESMGDAVDPDAALRRLVALGDAVLRMVLEDVATARPLVHALGYGQHLADLCARVPGLAAELAGRPAASRRDLRERKDAAYAAIAALDLSSAPTRDAFVRTGRALADLADDCFARVLAETDAPHGFAIMAMGKYGGRELNYASDVDVLFVYREADPDAAQRAARRAIAAMDGVFRVDADLRPEGRDGPLARSLDAYRAYYERWAAVWELQALVKCRFAAGDERTGAELLDLASRHVWPESLRPEAIEEIRALKARAEREVDRGGLRDREVKRGAGGIRDVEFAVQLLQLVHGRARPELRVANTLDALGVLGSLGFVGEDDVHDLEDAYVLLRHVEHRLQLAHGRQTHTLPEGPPERARIARALWTRPEAFEDTWRRTTAVVRRIHEKLFYRPLLETFARMPADAQDRLSALGFDRPQASGAAIATLTAGTSRRAILMRAILPGLLAWLAETPDPDMGLLRLADLVPRLEPTPHLIAMLRDEPPTAELLCRALGTGPAMATVLEREPLLVGELSAGPYPDRAGLATEARSVAARSSDPGSALRRLKNAEWLRIVSRDLAAGEDRGAFVPASAALSGLADACVATALEFSRDAMGRRFGVPPGGFAVVAMGRYGGEELSYASDLDVLFVYERNADCPDGTEARIFHTLVAENIAAILGGSPPAFVVDAELRPEGRNGPLVRSLASYEAYYSRWADTWEFQALTRARHAAGDPEVTSLLIDSAADRIWPASMTAERITEIRRMKARIERERVSSRDDARFHVKLGTGGLADVEFTVQLLQMRHGHAHPEIRRPDTLQGIDALAAAALLDGEDADRLRDAYLLLNRVRNHLFLLRGLPTDVLPSREADLERLSRSLGYGRLSRARFLEEYRRVTRRSRQVCDRLFYGIGTS